MAEIAVALDEALARRRQLGSPGVMAPRVIAHGEGWSVADVICTLGSARSLVRAFRIEFGMSPRAFRALQAG